MSFKALAWAIEQEDVEGLEKFVLFMIAYRDSHETPHGCYPSLDRLADDCGIGRSTVANHVNSLESKGKIKRTNRFQDKGNQTSNHYELVGVWGEWGPESGRGESRIGTGMGTDPGRGESRIGTGRGPESGHEPAVEPASDRHVEPSNNSEQNFSDKPNDPEQAFKIATAFFRRQCNHNLGTRGRGEQELGSKWAAGINEHGMEAFMGAFKLWAIELKESGRAKRISWPLAAFLNDLVTHVDAYHIENSRVPEVDDGGGMLTVKDIIREREERERELEKKRAQNRS